MWARFSFTTKFQASSEFSVNFVKNFKNTYFVVHLRTVASAPGFRRVDQKLELSHEILNLSNNVTNDVKNIVARTYVFNASGFFFIIFCTWKVFLKSDPHRRKNCFIYLNETPLKMMENAFYFIFKAFFVLKISKFLFRFFGQVEKTTWLER